MPRGAVASDADPAGAVTRGQRAVLLGSAAAATLTTWLWLIRMSASPHHLHSALLMPGGHHPLDVRSFASLVLMWQAMMVAMMTPSVMKWLLTFAALPARGRKAGQAATTFGPAAAFAGGYFVAWLAYSIAGAALQAALQKSGLLAGDGRLPRSIAGIVLIAAGLLHFTPLNRACLKHCRNPLTYFLAKWDKGPRGGFGFGIHHGAYCVGCCWAVMLTGFAMGVMNMAWMAFLTLLICAEKVAPHGDRIGAAGAVAITLWGAMLLAF